MEILAIKFYIAIAGQRVRFTATKVTAIETSIIVYYAHSDLNPVSCANTLDDGPLLNSIFKFSDQRKCKLNNRLSKSKYASQWLCSNDS